MPKYKVNGRTFNIPDNEVDLFEADFPEAQLHYQTNDGRKFTIYANERKDFLSDFPDATELGWSETIKEQAKQADPFQPEENLVQPMFGSMSYQDNIGKPEDYSYYPSPLSEEGRADYEPITAEERSKQEYEMLMRQLEDFNAANGNMMDTYEAYEKAARHQVNEGGFAIDTPERRYLDENSSTYHQRKKEKDELNARIKNNSYFNEMRMAEADAANETVDAISNLMAQNEAENSELHKKMQAMNALAMNPRGSFSGFSKTKKMQEYVDERDDLLTAKRLYENTAQVYAAPINDGEDILKKFGQGFGQRLDDADFWSMGIVGIADDMNARAAFQKIQDKFGSVKEFANLTDAEIDALLTPSEQLLINAVMDNNAALYARKDNTAGAYEAGAGAADSLMFMAQFLLTGGVGDAATVGTAAHRRLVNWLGRKVGSMSNGLMKDVARGAVKLGVGTAESIGKALVMTPLMPHTYANIADKMMSFDDNGELMDTTDAIISGSIDALIETWSESTGDFVNKVLGVPGDITKGIAKKALKNVDFSDWGKAMNAPIMKILKKGGFNGFLGEMGEEFIGNATRSLIGTIAPGSGLDPEALKNFAQWEQLLVTAGSFAPMTIFGIGTSSAQYGLAKRKLNNAQKAFESMLRGASYTEDQAKFIIDELLGSTDAHLTPERLVANFSPLLRELAFNDKFANNRTQALNSAIDFMWQIARYRTFDGVYHRLQEQQRNDMLAEIQEGTGREFWTTRLSEQAGLDGTAYETDEVRAVEFNDGRVAYVLGGDGVNNTVVYNDGQTGFLSEEQLNEGKANGSIVSDATMGLNDYLTQQVARVRMTEEEQRMFAERNSNIGAVRAQFPIDATVELGTTEAPIQGVVRQQTPTGVIVESPAGVSQLTWEELGHTIGIEVNPQTDAQMEEEAINNLEIADLQRRRERERRRTQRNAAAEAALAEEQMVDEAENEGLEKPIPMKADGTVDQTAFWNESPARWAQWKTEQRQDGGAYASTYIQNAIGILEGQIAESEAAFLAESDFDAKDALEQTINQQRARLAELQDLALQYMPSVIPAETSAEAFAEQTQPGAETSQPAVMAERQKFELDAEYQRRLSLAKTLAEKEMILKEYFEAISAGSMEAVVMNKQNYKQIMKDMGCDESAIEEVTNAIKEAEEENTAVNALHVNDKIFVIAEYNYTVEQGRVSYVHERQHNITKRNPDLIQRVLSLGLGRETLQKIVRTFSGTDFYDEKSDEVLADEILSSAMEIAYTFDDFSVTLSKLGIPIELINLINEINDEQRNDYSLANARRNTIQRNDRQGSSGQNVGDQGEVSGGILGEERDGSQETGLRGTESGEPTTGGAEASEEGLQVPVAEVEEESEEEPKGPDFRITGEEPEDIEDITEPDGTVRFSVRTYHDWTDNLGHHHKGTRAMVIEKMEEMKFSKRDIKKMVAKMDTAYEYMEKLRTLTDDQGRVRFEEFNEWAKATPLYKQVGRDYVKAITSLVSNGDYPINLELTTDCIKREAFTHLLNALVKRGAQLSGMGPAQIITMQKVMKQYGIEVACQLCFVEGKRLQIVNWASQIVEDWNDALEQAGVETDEYFEFGKDGDAFIPSEEWRTYEDKPKLLKALKAIDDAALLFQGIDPETFKAQREANQEAVAEYIKEKSEAWAKKNNKPASEWKPNDVQKAEIKKLTHQGLAPSYVNENLLEYRDAFNRMRNEWLEKHPNADPLSFSPTKKQWEALDKIRNRQIDNVKAKMVRLIMEHPEMRKKMTINDLLGSKGLMEIRQQHGQPYADLYSIILQRFGTGTPKPVQDAVPYDGEVLTLTESAFKKANEIGGARLFSFSDFDITKVFDYMQMFFDLEAKRQKLQSYTKEVAAVLIFGRSNAKFNISTLAHAFVPTEVQEEYKKASEKKQKELRHKWAENAGLIVDENGTITGINFSEEHSVSPEFAQSIFRDDTRNKDCGAIMVGASVNHAIYSAAVNWIRMVIPFHLSGMPLAAREKTDVLWYTDNTEYQSTRKKTKEGWSKIEASKDTFNLYEGMDQPGWDMRQRAKDYLAWCAENGYRPKFDWGINSDYYRAYCEEAGYTPNQQIIDIMDADTTDGVWNQYYKFLTDFTAYKPVFNEQGEMIDEISSPQLAVESNFDFSEMEKEVLFEGENSMLGHREENIKRTENYIEEIADRVVPFLNGEISEEEMNLREDVHYENRADAELYLNAQKKSEGPIDLVEEAKKAQAKHDAKKSDVRFRMSNNNQAIFVSNAARAVEGIKPEKATPEQWLKMIEKAGGLKAGEDKWMGLSDWLKASDKKTLTKAEVLDFINESMIIINEVHYGVRAEEAAAEQHALLEQRVNERYKEILDSIQDIEDYDEKRTKAFEQLKDELDEWGDYVDLDMYNVYLTFPYEDLGDYIEMADIFGVEISLGNPIYDVRLNYTTDGLNNKREIALTVPTIESWNESDLTHFGDAGEGRAVAWVRFGETTIKNKESDEALYNQSIDELNAFWDSMREKYGNGWQEYMSEEEKLREKEIVAKYRQLRKDNYRKVLVIDEIQSKRHQEGREKGYKKSKAEIEQYLSDNGYEVKEDGNFYNFYKNGELERRIAKGLMHNSMDKAKRFYVAALNKDESYNSGIPDAPFDKNWHELAMKRMLRYAAENGYDVIAWTKGEQQADRYNIGGTISEIKSTKYPRGYEVVSFGNNGNIVHNEVFADESAMAGVYGKEMAQRIIESVDALEPSETATISGDNLRIGGEGMKGFYDKMLPAFMNKYGKKWGVKVEDINLPNLGNSGYTMHSVPVTEEMKASVMEGQVMFRVRGENESAMDFHQSMIDAFLAKYEPNAEVKLYPINRETAKEMGVTIDELKKMRGMYLPDEDIIAIFANEEETNGEEVENSLFHESIHKLANFYPYMVDAGKWLWDNASMGSALTKHKDMIEQAYANVPEAARYEEMLAWVLGSCMEEGCVDILASGMPANERDIIEQITNEIGYDIEKESIQRTGRKTVESKEPGKAEETRGESAGEGKNLGEEIRFRTSEITPEVRAEMDTIAAIAIVNGNYMKAPNGKDSNLTAEQWAMVRTKNFKSWFGDWENDPENASKVVDENGEPMVVYHGTGADFTKFVAWESDRGYYDWELAHFGTKEQAEDAMRTAPGNKHIMELFLNIRKPYRISDQEDNDSWRYAAKQAAYGMFADQNGEKADGLVYLNMYEGKTPADSYAVWNPSQIKSATDNTGEFSNEDGDIRFRMTDSKGNTLTPDQEAFFGNSKAVDKDGNLLVLYHGTPRAGFTEFTSGWFTTSKEDAISYSGDRKGRMFDPNEKYEAETLTAGDYRLGYMTFDSEEDRAAFLAEHPEAENAVSEAEFDSMTLQADEEYDDLIAKKPELQKIWKAYREYERERFVDTTIADLLANTKAYTEDDLRRAMLAYDSNANFDSLDDMDAEERKDALVSALRNADEETEGGIADMKVVTRVPRNGEGLKHNDLGNRTYEVYANIEKPYEIDAAGRSSEFESGDVYKAVDEALSNPKYDGVIIRNWRVGRYQHLGDVVVPKNGSQVQLVSNESPAIEASEDAISFRIVTDEQTLDKLNNEPTIKVYRAMQLIDGKLYPPMAGKTAAKAGEKRQWGKPIELGKWEESEERPDLAIPDVYKKGPKKGQQKVDKDGNPKWVFRLDKGNGTTVDAAYNPYFHTSPTPLNDQFSSAQSRPELVTVEVEIPVSELTSGYKADKAKDGVGKMEWKAGVVQSKLSGTRTVILSRWDKPVRIVPDSEVADVIVKMFEGKDIVMPSNVVTPSLRAELESRGVPFVETDNQGNPIEETRFRVTGTPTEAVVAEGLNLSPAQTAELAGNIFAALPEESRKKITDGLNGNILGLQDAILQIPTSLAMKEEWNDEDRQMAEVVAEQMTKAVGIEMTRPFSASEALWTLYNAVNKSTDLVSEASRALVRRNLGFDSQTLEMEKDARDGVRFRTVGNASANAQASMYNRGAANVRTRLKESFVDMNASVEELVKAIEKRSGKVAEGFENILMALNQQSSKGLAAMEAYEQKFLNKMFDAIREIMDKTDFKYEDIVRYVILKHGLERNVKLAQRDAKAHYQEIYDDIIAKIKGMNPAQKRTYLTNAQLRDADAKAELARLQAVNTSALTPDQLRDHKKELAKAKKEATEAAEHLVRAQKIATMTEQDAQDELDKIFKKIEKGTDSVYKEMRENDYSGISSMFYDTLGVDRKNYATEEEYQAALMQAKADKYDNLGDIEGAAQMEVTLFENAVNTDNLWKSINRATKETLRQQYDANMISKDQYLNLRDMFDFYVPLRGFADNTAEDMYTYYRKPNSTGYTKPILGAEGRKTEAESPFGWIAAMAGSAIASNVKNEAKLALYYFVANRPDNGIATLSKTWFVHTPGDVDANGKKIFRPAYPPFSEDLSSASAKADYEVWQANMKNLQAQGLAYEAGQRLNLGNSVVNISDTNKPEHIVNVKVGGKDYTIVINGNPRAAQAINGDLNIESSAQDYSSVFGPMLRWMSSVNTSYNPEFWITNMMRDVAFTLMAVNIKGDPAYRKKFGKNYLKALKVVSMVAKNEKGTLGNSYIENMYKDFVKYGGVTGYTQIKDSETWEKEIENYLSSNDPDSLRSGKFMRGMKSVFHAFHRFGESLEQVSRFAAFLTAVETGKSINEAINDAKEITVNFNRKGSGKMITLEEAKYLTDKNGQPLNKLEQWAAVGLSSIAPLGRRMIMFFNAAIQGLNATYKLYAKNKTRAIGWALGYAAVGMINAVLHAMLDDDDDYLDIPQYERRNSLMIGGNGAYFKWALPQEARAFYALGDLAVESVMGRNPHQNVIGEALKISTEILPINPSEGWKAFMPSVAIPFVELAFNEDYKGAPIYNEQKWLTEEERERSTKWSKAYSGTGDLYVYIAKVLNAATGGDEHDAGLINLQPEKMEHLVQSAFGGTIRTADKFINTIMAAFNPEEDMTVRQSPFLNRILTINDERYKNVHVNDVFDYYKAEAEHAQTLLKQYTKDRDADALKDLKSSDEYKWATIYSKYKKPIKKYQEAIRAADTTNERMELMKQQDELKRKMIKEISEL